MTAQQTQLLNSTCFQLIQLQCEFLYVGCSVMLLCGLSRLTAEVVVLAETVDVARKTLPSSRDLALHRVLYVPSAHDSMHFQV